MGSQCDQDPTGDCPHLTTNVSWHDRMIKVARVTEAFVNIVSVQVKMARYGRQTVSVDVDTGVLLFDKKTGTFGVETVSHERGKQNTCVTF